MTMTVSAASARFDTQGKTREELLAIGKQRLQQFRTQKQQQVKQQKQIQLKLAQQQLQQQVKQQSAQASQDQSYAVGIIESQTTALETTNAQHNIITGASVLSSSTLSPQQQQQQPALFNLIDTQTDTLNRHSRLNTQRSHSINENATPAQHNTLTNNANATDTATDSRQTPSNNEVNVIVAAPSLNQHSNQQETQNAHQHHDAKHTQQTRIQSIDQSQTTTLHSSQHSHSHSHSPTHADTHTGSDTNQSTADSTTQQSSLRKFSPPSSRSFTASLHSTPLSHALQHQHDHPAEAAKHTHTQSQPNSSVHIQSTPILRSDSLDSHQQQLQQQHSTPSNDSPLTDDQVKASSQVSACDENAVEFQRQMQEKESQIQHLEGELDALRKQHQQLQQEMQCNKLQAEQQTEANSDTSASLTDTIDWLRSDNDRLQLELKSLNDALKTRNCTIAEFTNDNTQLIKEIEELSRELNQSKSKIKILTAYDEAANKQQYNQDIEATSVDILKYRLQVIVQLFNQLEDWSQQIQSHVSEITALMSIASFNLEIKQQHDDVVPETNANPTQAFKPSEPSKTISPTQQSNKTNTPSNHVHTAHHDADAAVAAEDDDGHVHTSTVPNTVSLLSPSIAPHPLVDVESVVQHAKHIEQLTAQCRSQIQQAIHTTQAQRLEAQFIAENRTDNSHSHHALNLPPSPSSQSSLQFELILLNEKCEALQRDKMLLAQRIETQQEERQTLLRSFYEIVKRMQEQTHTQTQSQTQPSLKDSTQQRQQDAAQVDLLVALSSERHFEAFIEQTQQPKQQQQRQLILQQANPITNHELERGNQQFPQQHADKQHTRIQQQQQQRNFLTALLQLLFGLVKTEEQDTTVNHWQIHSETSKVLMI